MSRIGDLIADLCPRGVEFFPLATVAAFSDTRVNAAELDGSTFVGVENLLPNKGGRIDASYSPNTHRLTAYEVGDVLLGNIRPYLKKIWLATENGGCSGDVLALRVRPSFRVRLAPKFLYYLISTDDFFAYDMQHAKGGKMPRGSKEAILRYRIPLPPIEVQRATVKVLDAFTELEAELEAELELRLRQYAHYRAALLTFGDHIPRKSLGEIATIGTGSHDTKDAIAEGDYVFYARGRDPLRLDSFDFDERAIITAGDGVGVGKVFHFADGKYALHQRAYRIVPDAGIDARYMYHYLVTDFARYLEGISVHASVTSLRRPMFLKYPVAVPPLEEQERIVAILDRFDALVNDLSIGLPAELNARRKQYEYYRDLLLTFPEAA